MERFVGKPAPQFTMETISGDGENFGQVSLTDYKGKWLIFFFYPMDFTFVCPTEITALSKRYDEFRKLDCEVLGASTDSKFSHRAWINTPVEENGLGKINFPLASDNTHQVAKEYGVFFEQDGTAMRGLFIIDPEGIVRYQVVSDDSVGRSVDETLRVLQALQSGGLCPADWKPGQAHLEAK